MKPLPVMHETQVHRFDPWVRKIPWRLKCQPTPVFLPEKSHGWEEPGELQSIGSQELDRTWQLNPHPHPHMRIKWKNAYTMLDTMPGIY